MAPNFWNSERRYHLMQSLKGFKPYGIDKHFHMALIMENFRARTGLNVKVDQLWDQIETLYDLNGLTQREMEKTRERLANVEGEFQLENV